VKTARSKKLARSLGKKNSKDARLLGLIDAAALDQEQKKETEKKTEEEALSILVWRLEKMFFLQLLSKVEREWPCTETKPTLHHRATARWHAMAPLFIAERMKVERWVRCHTV